MGRPIESSKRGTASPIYLSKQQLAHRTGFSPATIQRLKDAGKIPFFQPSGKGGKVVYPPDAIEVIAHQRATGPAQSNKRPDAGRDRGGRVSGPRPRWQTKLT